MTSLEKKASDKKAPEKKTLEARVLMDEGGIKITNGLVTTPSGEFPVRDIQAMEHRVRKPVMGPALLALLGTVNLGIALQGTFWLDYLASLVMLSIGAFWWLRGTRYVLLLTTPAKGKREVWFSRQEAQLRRATELLKPLIDRRQAQRED